MPNRDDRSSPAQAGFDSDFDPASATLPDDPGLLAMIGAIAMGAMLGSLGRFMLSEAWPTAEGAFPWAMLAINTSGCLGLGMLMGILAGKRMGSATFAGLARPALGTGLLGGYTSFSSYALDAHDLLDVGRADLAFGYLAASVVAGVSAVLVGRAVPMTVSRVGVTTSGECE